MNESFRIFEKTLREVGTLQQRLESSYDEIGETLGKYYEINESEEKVEEGNEFGAARAKAIANGDKDFSVDGKKYPVKSVDKDDKENAKEFTTESVLNERAEPMITDKEAELVRKALSKATGVAVETDVTDARWHGGASDFGFEGGQDFLMYVGRYDNEDGEHDTYTVSVEGSGDQLGMEKAKDFKGIVKAAMKLAKKYKKRLTTESKGNKMKLKDLLHESYGFGELPSSKLMKMKVSAKDMLNSVRNTKVNKEENTIKEGFSTWEMRFSDMNLGGVKLSKKNVYKVKARNTVEAIKKAAKMAGVGDSWIATQTHSLKKIG